MADMCQCACNREVSEQERERERERDRERERGGGGGGGGWRTGTEKWLVLSSKEKKKGRVISCLSIHMHLNGKSQL